VCTGRTENEVFLAAGAALVETSFHQVIGVLREGLAGTNRAEFMAELDAYWGEQDNVRKLASIIEPGPMPRRLFWVIERKNKIPGTVFDCGDRYRQLHRLEPNVDIHLSDRGLYLPLSPGANVPAVHWTERWSAPKVRDQLLPQMSAAARRRAEEHFADFKGSDAVVVFAAPLPGGGEVQFGFWFRGLDSGHPLGAKGSAAWVEPLSLTRLDPTYLRGRGGAASALAQKHVLVVGCGAVGGHVAIELARAGVGKLTLLDADILTPDNLFRHVLGQPFVDMGKALALATFVKGSLPYVEATPLVADAWEGLPKGDFEAVLLCTGNHALEMHLEREARARGTTTLAGWVEPLGVGGHPVLGNPGRPGCLRCLYTDASGDLCRARCELLSNGEQLDLSLGGCGSVHTPHGSLAAVRTAVDLVSLAVDVLSDELHEAMVRTCRGSPREAVAAGGDLTPFHDRSQEDWRGFHAPGCSECGGE